MIIYCLYKCWKMFEAAFAAAAKRFYNYKYNLLRIKLTENGVMAVRFVADASPLNWRVGRCVQGSGQPFEMARRRLTS